MTPAASTQASAAAGEHLHMRIMNLQTPAHVENYSQDARICFKEGHRLARHDAAELALRSDAIRERLLAALQALAFEYDRDTPAYRAALVAIAEATSGSQA